MVVRTGNCPPDPDQFARLAEYGFEALEVYLEPQQLNTFGSIYQDCRDALLPLRGLHTLHVTLPNAEYFARLNSQAR